MTPQDLFAYQDTMLRVSQDIHETSPGAEFSVLWDDGKMSMVTGLHKVRIWNSLGSVEFHIEHNDILERGNAYKGFLALAAVQIGKKLTM
jgi:hypothetical protein